MCPRRKSIGSEKPKRMDRYASKSIKDKQMQKLAFISRHQPDSEQKRLAAKAGYELVHVGDMDAFTVDAGFIEKEYSGAVVVHPAAALRLIAMSGAGFVVGVFENSNRAPEGEKPQFAAKRLHLFGMEVKSWWYSS